MYILNYILPLDSNIRKGIKKASPSTIFLDNSFYAFLIELEIPEDIFTLCLGV